VLVRVDKINDVRCLDLVSSLKKSSDNPTMICKARRSSGTINTSKDEVGMREY